jgi:hypothetical protein
MVRKPFRVDDQSPVLPDLYENDWNNQPCTVPVRATDPTLSAAAASSETAGTQFRKGSTKVVLSASVLNFEPLVVKW